MLIKTSELTGAALDWSVRHAQSGKAPIDYAPNRDNFSTCWNKGGPIIEREGISWHCGSKTSWHAYVCGSFENFSGQTPLIAAMRCYVATKLGDTVEVPEELL